MAHSLHRKKRLRQNEAHRARNRWRKRRYREAIKQYQEAILHGSVEDAQKQLSGIYRLLDQIASTGALHKNTAARYKGRLAARLEAKRTARA